MNESPSEDKREPSPIIKNFILPKFGLPSRLARTTYWGIIASVFLAIIYASVSMIDITVKVSGTIRPEYGSQVIQSPVASETAKICVLENQFVKKGDTLLILKAKSVKEKASFLNKKHLTIIKEIGDLNKLIDLNQPMPTFHFLTYQKQMSVRKAQWELLKKEYEVDSNRFERKKKLFNKKHKYIAYAEYEKDELAKIQKQLALEKWEQKHLEEITRLIKEKDLEKLGLESDLNSTSFEKEKFTILSPIDGYVSELSLKAEDKFIQTGANVAVISPAQNQIAEFFVPPKDVGFLKTGLKIRYKIDAFPFQEWGMLEGKIDEIAKDITVSNKNNPNDIVFKIKATFDKKVLRSRRLEKEVEVKSGMTYQASIIVAEKRMITMLWDKVISYFAL